MHGEKATLHVEYWWSWCAPKTWGYCFCSICVSGPLLYTCTGGARVTVYASISIDSSKHTHIFCVCVDGFFYVSASCVYVVIVLASWKLIYELQHILMARSTCMLCMWYCFCLACMCVYGFLLCFWRQQVTVHMHKKRYMCVIHSWCVWVVIHVCCTLIWKDVLASLPCQSVCAYICPTYVLIHIHLCVHTRWRVFYIRACMHWRLVYVAASFSSCGMYTYPCVVYITYVYAWARENALIYTFLFRVIYIYIYIYILKSILQCPTYFGWYYFFLAFCVNPKLLCWRNKIGKLGKLRCAFGGKAARRLRCWWRGDKAFGWRGGVAGAVRASVLLAAFILVSTCVCV